MLIFFHMIKIQQKLNDAIQNYAQINGRNIKNVFCRVKKEANVIHTNKMER